MYVKIFKFDQCSKNICKNLYKIYKLREIYKYKCEFIKLNFLIKTFINVNLIKLKFKLFKNVILL